MFDREIDRTIDEVGRDMTAGEPAHHFRSRVLARIEARQHPERPTWQPRMIAAAAVAVIAAIVAGTVVVKRLRGPETTAPRTTATVATPGDRGRETDAASEWTTPPARVDVTLGGGAGVSGRRSDRGAQTTAPHREMRASLTDGIAALAPPPLEAESIAFGELAAPPPLAVEQLEPIAPIAVAPLGEGVRPE